MKRFVICLCIFLVLATGLSAKQPWDDAVKNGNTAFDKKDYQTAYKEYETAMEAGCMDGVVFYRLLISADKAGFITEQDKSLYYFLSFVLFKAENSTHAYVEEARKMMYPQDAARKAEVQALEKALNAFAKKDYPGCYKLYNDVLAKIDTDNYFYFIVNSFIRYQFAFCAEKVGGLKDEAIGAYLTAYGNFASQYESHFYYTAMRDKFKSNPLPFLTYTVQTNDTIHFQFVFDLAGNAAFQGKKGAETFAALFSAAIPEIRTMLKPLFFTNVTILDEQLRLINLLLEQQEEAMAEDLLATLVGNENAKQGKGVNIYEVAGKKKMDRITDLLILLGSELPQDFAGSLSLKSYLAYLEKKHNEYYITLQTIRQEMGAKLNALLKPEKDEFETTAAFELRRKQGLVQVAESKTTLGANMEAVKAAYYSDLAKLITIKITNAVVPGTMTINPYDADNEWFPVTIEFIPDFFLEKYITGPLKSITAYYKIPLLKAKAFKEANELAKFQARGVFAYNQDSERLSLNKVVIETGDTRKEAVLPLYAVPDVRISRQKDALVLNWAVVLGAPAKYMIKRIEYGLAERSREWEVTATHSWKDTTAQPGIEYKYQVRSLGESAVSPWSAEQAGQLFTAGDEVAWEFPLAPLTTGQQFVLESSTGRLYCFMFYEKPADTSDPGYYEYQPAERGFKGVCLDAVTGELLWEKSYPTAWDWYAENSFLSAPLVTDTDDLLLQSNGNIYCIDAALGNIIWSYENSASMNFGYSVAPVRYLARLFAAGTNETDYDYYEGTPNGIVICLDEGAGVCMWSVNIKGSIDGMQLTRRGNLVVTTTENTYYLDTETGQDLGMLPQEDAPLAIREAMPAFGNYSYSYDTDPAKIVCRYAEDN